MLIISSKPVLPATPFNRGPGLLHLDKNDSAVAKYAFYHEDVRIPAGTMVSLHSKDERYVTYELSLPCKHS